MFLKALSSAQICIRIMVCIYFFRQRQCHIRKTMMHQHHAAIRTEGRILGYVRLAMSITFHSFSS
uniref:Uncharacterized protein n=1 Tax=Arundo donax TaxID=35708 RepID=A0A0A9DTF6_ARUDO